MNVVKQLIFFIEPGIMNLSNVDIVIAAAHLTDDLAFKIGGGILEDRQLMQFSGEVLHAGLGEFIKVSAGIGTTVSKKGFLGGSRENQVEKAGCLQTLQRETAVTNGNGEHGRNDRGAHKPFQCNEVISAMRFLSDCQHHLCRQMDPGISSGKIGLYHDCVSLLISSQACN